LVLGLNNGNDRRINGSLRKCPIPEWKERRKHVGTFVVYRYLAIVVRKVTTEITNRIPKAIRHYQQLTITIPHFPTNSK